MEAKKRRDLVRDALGRVEMARIQKAADTFLGGVVHIELARPDGVALEADAEDLALDGGDDPFLIIILQHLVERFLQAKPRPHPVGRDVLVAVRDPDVHGDFSE